MDKIVSLCKRRGFIFQSSEIYGGLSSCWDYGPLGAELKRNVKAAWWKAVVHDRDDVVGLDASILMHPRTWDASGHTKNFHDVLVDCKYCKKRFREDKLNERDCRTPEKCDFTAGRAFNLMFKTQLGAVQEESSVAYLRPETAQGIFVNFNNVIDSTGKSLPFGIAQIGKSFRNEVTPGNFTFRMREFEQMEIEYFTEPEQSDQWYNQWIESRFRWYVDLGIRQENLRLRAHGENELAHYAKACSDVEYKFPFGWSELEGVANRAEYDLKQHSEFSGADMRFHDQINQRKFFPYVIEPSGGVDRATLAFLVDAYHEEEVEGRERIVLKLSKHLAPRKVAVFPLLKKNSEMVSLAKNLKKDLQKNFTCVYDDTAAIGKLYRRQDEVGTFFCVTVDVESLSDHQVTVRDRDTMRQERVSLDRLKLYLTEKLSG